MKMLNESDDKIFLTGATGFVGQQLSQYLDEHNFQLKILCRTPSASSSKNTEIVKVELENIDSWSQYLDGCSVIIHLAARVHVMNDTSKNPLEDFRKVNTHATLNLASQAAEAGVKRFIFLSSIKVSGEETQLNRPFKSSHKPKPVDPYAISKYEAEEGLKNLSEQTGMEVVIIRPPLIYGPGVKANFLSMIKWLSKGLPLPFGAINNKRSMVGLTNLLDLIITCINHPKAANQTFLVSDDRDISTTELLVLIGNALNKKTRLLAIPGKYIYLFASSIGKKSLAHRLCGSLQVDIEHTKKTLNWKPPVTMESELVKTIEKFRKVQK